MTSLRKRVSSYFRQLSFHNEPREKRHSINENSFVTKYLSEQIKLIDGPPVLYGKTPNDLPNFELGTYSTGAQNIVGCSTGPNGGLTSVKRIEKHLSIPDVDIDFIDTQDEIADQKHKSPIPVRNKKVLDQNAMKIKVAGQTYVVSNNLKNNSNRKSRSLGSLQDLTTLDSNQSEDSCNTNTTNACATNIVTINNNNEVHAQCKNKNTTTTTTNNQHECSNDTDSFKTKNNCCEISNTEPSISNCDQNVHVDNNVDKTSEKPEISNENTKESDKSSDKNCEITKNEDAKDGINKNFPLSKSKSANSAFDRKKKGKIIRLTERPGSQGAQESTNLNRSENSEQLPTQWNRKTDLAYGISDSLYDTNQVTKCKNGNPIADCFGIIARSDSAILALADGVNWGEKACIAAKSAIHGCVHYLNKTIFDDTSLFDFDSSQSKNTNFEIIFLKDTPINTTNFPAINTTPPTPKCLENRISNTNEVFVSLLRAFNSAHNLILENEGMLTTLTVAVVLPLKSSHYKKQPAVAANIPSKEPENLSVKYVCCVCNVGDTLAYIYSQKYGVREITKGSHDVNSIRDMRDALGALGPVDGINPELNNLTLSVTTLDAGDIVMIASDGLTDNYDPSVSKFTVNAVGNDAVKQSKIGNTAAKQGQQVNAHAQPQAHALQHGHPQAQHKDRIINRPPRSSKASTQLTKSSSRQSLTQSSSVSNQTRLTPSNVSRLAKDALITAKHLESAKNSSHSSKSSVHRHASTSTLQSADSTSKSPPEKSGTDFVDNSNPLVAQFMLDNALSSSNVNSSTSTDTTDNSRMNLDSSKRNITDKTTGSSSNKTKIDVNISYKSSQSNTKQLEPDKSYRRVVSMINPKTESSDKENKTKNFNPLSKSSSTSRVLKQAKTNTNQNVNQSNTNQSKMAFLRSKTSIDFNNSIPKQIRIHRNEDGLPYVTAIQKYELTLLLIEDILRRGITGRDKPCVTARILCENLLRYTISITAAKRRTLEDNDLYYDNKNDVMVEVSAREKKMRRKRCLEKIQNLPGKLDHVSVVAYNVGNVVFEEG